MRQGLVLTENFHDLRDLISLCDSVDDKKSIFSSEVLENLIDMSYFQSDNNVDDEDDDDDDDDDSNKYLLFYFIKFSKSYPCLRSSSISIEFYSSVICYTLMGWRVIQKIELFSRNK